MRCTTCQYENDLGTKFCEECGNKLARVCSACGVELKPTTKFCPECGASIAVTATAVERLVRHVENYTPKHLADKILQSKSSLEGERKQVTVLFADVKGSLALAEQLDPEALHVMLDRFFEVLADGVHRFEGTVNQYTGDGIMALFGAPIAHEDHAQRACYAALHLRDALRELTREVKRRCGLDFATRIGINSGDVVVGKIGDDLRMDYTAQGLTVGLAQRMESLAAGGSIYLAPPTVALVQGFFSLEDLGEFPVKGAHGPVHVHELTGLGSSRTRFDLARVRGLSRFVGRASDLRALDEALAQTAAGNGQVVGVVAEAGTGKSRLCFEFLEQCRGSGLQVIVARAVAHGRNIPLLPILEIFRAYFGITTRDDDLSAREKIAGRLVVLDQRYSETLPLLFDFLGVADPASPVPQLDPEVRQRQLIDLMRQITKRASEAQPTVMMIEDLHWLDAASATFLEHMVDARAGTRSLLLLNFRPEYRAEWMQKSWYRQIPLAPLGREAVTELLSDLLGSDRSLDGLVDPVIARTGGNPFFVEEIVQSLIEDGHLVGRRGTYRLVTPIERLEVPATVQAVLAARIDRLAERDKRLLQVAAVIGKDFPEPLLATVSEMPAHELKAALMALIRAEFIHEKTLYPVAEYAFKHPLTQEVALGSQLKERRRQVHAALAHALERDVARLDECAALLAHHWEEAGDAWRAAQWHRRAAEWMGHADSLEAWRHWQRVRELLRGLPKEHAVAELGILACTRWLGVSLQVEMKPDEARLVFEEGQAYARAIKNRGAEMSLSQAYAWTFYLVGDVRTYLEMALANQSEAAAIDDAGIQTHAGMYVVFAFWLVGRFREAITLADEVLAMAPRHTPAETWLIGVNPYILLTYHRGISLIPRGEVKEGLAGLSLASRLADEDTSPAIKGYTRWGVAEANYHLEEPERALEAAHQVEQISREIGNPPSIIALSQFMLAYAYLAAGQPDNAIAPAQMAMEIYGRVERAQVGWPCMLLAEAYLTAGDLRAAERTAREAIILCERSSRSFYQAAAHGVLARTLLRRGGIASRVMVETELAKAAELIKQTGACILAPALYEWRAELAAATGEEAARVEYLREAIAASEAIDAPRRAARLRKLVPTLS